MKTLKTIAALLFVITTYGQDYGYGYPDHQKIARFDKSYYSDELLYFESNKDQRKESNVISNDTHLKFKTSKRKDIPKIEIVVTDMQNSFNEYFILTRKDEVWNIKKSLK